MPIIGQSSVIDTPRWHKEHVTLNPQRHVCKSHLRVEHGRLMDWHCNEIAAMILGIVGVAMKFELECCDYSNIYIYNVMV